MSSKILLISANQVRSPDPVFPLGLSYVRAALRAAGHECAWFDCLTNSEPIERALENWRPDFVGISLRNIDDVLIRTRETFHKPVAAMVSVIHRVIDRPVILGGSGYSIFPESLLERTGADFGIVGEGEASLVQLVSALESGDEYGSIPGLVFRKDGALVCNAAAPATSPLDLSQEDRPTLATGFYLASGGMLNLQTQRGCARTCCYCTYPLIEGRHVQEREPERVAGEFEQLQRLGARYIFVVDSVFNSTPEHVGGICEALLRRGVKVPWGCFLRPQGLSLDLMRLMKRAGLTHIEFGTDSFSDGVLSTCRKGFTFGDVVRSSDLARRERIDFCHFLIAGGYGETHETLQQGFENSRHVQDGVILAVVGMRIYPGTYLFERAIAERRISRDEDLLQPAYYVATGLTEEEVFQQLKDHAKRSPNWIVGDPDPAYLEVVARLRQRGVVGPLWSYFSTIQSLGLGALGAKTQRGVFNAKTRRRKDAMD